MGEKESIAIKNIQILTLRLIFVGCAVLALASLATLRAAASPLVDFITVNSTDDGTPANDGKCTLREAILNANGNDQSGSTDCSGGDTVEQIVFDIAPGGIQTIHVSGSGLPQLTNLSDSVYIDGTTQTGCASFPCIVLDGTNAGTGADGIQLNDGPTLVQGLVIENFGGDGIHLLAGGDTIKGNFIGVAVDGTTVAGNGGDGIFMDNAPGDVIGGLTTAARNVIAGNAGAGIHMGGSGSSENVIEGNYIGTDSSGTVALNSGVSTDTHQGILIDTGATKNFIGGTTAAYRNLLSGNSVGVVVGGLGTNQNSIEGNYIGTKANGTKPLANAFYGIWLDGPASSNQIGGTSAGARNIISGNTTAGVAFSVASADVLEGNSIGVGADKKSKIPNGTGVLLNGGASNDVIGGSAAGAGNIIAFNTHKGVSIGDISNDQSEINAISRNSIHDNGNIGIDLNGDGVTLNDALDADDGSNRLQNFPVLKSALSNTKLLKGRLNSSPNNQFTVEFFSNKQCDSSGYGEGQKFLGSTQVTTNANGVVKFAVVVSKFSRGAFITATATDSNGNTSEFSKCRTAI